MSVWGRIARAVHRAIQRLRRLSPWVDVVAQPGHRPDRLVGWYYALRQRGIRVRYRVVGIGGGPGTPIGSVGQTIKLIVHRDDETSAREILAGLTDETEQGGRG